MTTNRNVTKTNGSIINAWRGAQKPDAIAQALKIGEQITDLLTEATTLVQRARWSVDLIIEDAYTRCQEILNRLADEADRLAPVLLRLRAASKAVIS